MARFRRRHYLQELMTEAGFDILDHPADMGFHAWASSLPELFAESARALTSVLVDADSVKPVKEIQTEVTAHDRDYLLYNWLSEVLYYFDGEQFLFSDFKITLHTKSGADQLKLSATMRGESYQHHKHEIKTYVKAITLHQLAVTEHDGRCHAQVYLDI
jgi:SHS2 domain-containing protein